MNFLAHLFLGPQQPQLALGSLLGDFVKGPLVSMQLPEQVKQGVWLHRRIDSFTDAHPMVIRSKQRVSATRRRFAGIMVDMFYDHLLAAHWHRYSDRSLEHFTQDMYAVLLAQRAAIPQSAWPIIQRMAQQDWLTSYAELASLHQAVNNISRRFTRATTLPGGVAELEAEYSAFEEDFLSFMPEVIEFARAEATFLGSSR
ncbi:MAG: ACP phosphodiesterase [Pseudomonas profundi]|uniref:acyl carrier protein phosphodiesterase n=1 Tax=Pseudomonas profundi TaxID=1981513 RepID=UPI0030023133